EETATGEPVTELTAVSPCEPAHCRPTYVAGRAPVMVRGSGIVSGAMMPSMRTTPTHVSRETAPELAPRASPMPLSRTCHPLPAVEAPPAAPVVRLASLVRPPGRRIAASAIPLRPSAAAPYRVLSARPAYDRYPHNTTPARHTSTTGINWRTLQRTPGPVPARRPPQIDSTASSGHLRAAGPGTKQRRQS